MTDEPIHVNDAMVDAVRTEFQTLGRELRDVRDPLLRHTGEARSGAGQFAAALDDGLTAFELSWGEVFEVTSQTAGTLAANVGRMKLDFAALDLGD